MTRSIIPGPASLATTVSGPAALATIAMLALTGCWSMAPKYERPAAPIPGALPAGELRGNRRAWALVFRCELTARERECGEGEALHV